MRFIRTTGCPYCGGEVGSTGASDRMCVNLPKAAFFVVGRSLEIGAGRDDEERLFLTVESFGSQNAADCLRDRRTG